jgi:CubicO group peptidase (beta-lactamase class C family)
MKRTEFSTFTYIIAGIILLFISTQTIAQNGFSNETKARLQHVVDSFLQQSSPAYVGGMSIAINIHDLATWQGAGGFASQAVNQENYPINSGVPFTTNTVSRAYSITKTFTAALVLELAHEGYFKLDETIGKYFPEMASKAPQLNRTVTIQQLLNHESGYQDWEDNMVLQYQILSNPTKVWDYYDLMQYTDQLTVPGIRREYSHNNYVFLGGIIEKATGQKLQDLYRDRFFTPLGLHSIFLEGRENLAATLAMPHDIILGALGVPGFPYAFTNISAFPYTAITSLSFSGGGLVSDAKDLAIWANALYGGRVVSGSTLNAILHSISDTADTYGNRLGYGIKMVNKIDGQWDFIGHNGSAPGYRTSMFYQPDRKMTISVLTNFANADPYIISRELYKALPQFLGGKDNNNENKIVLCYKQKSMEVNRTTAEHLVIDGATLGNCEQQQQQNVPGAADNFTIYPNPSTGGKVIVAFTSLQTGNAIFTINNMNGNIVSTAYNGSVKMGEMKQLEIQTGNLRPGTYYCRLQIGSATSEQKLMIVK